GPAATVNVTHFGTSIYGALLPVCLGGLPGGCVSVGPVAGDRAAGAGGYDGRSLLGLRGRSKVTANADERGCGGAASEGLAWGAVRGLGLAVPVWGEGEGARFRASAWNCADQPGPAHCPWTEWR